MKTNADGLERRLKEFGERVRSAWKKEHPASPEQVAVFNEEVKKQLEQRLKNQPSDSARTANQKQSAFRKNAATNSESSGNSQGQGHSH